MASPPNYYSQSPTALSPTYQSHSMLPKKRPSTDHAQPPTLKRRKASNISVTSVGTPSSQHPLRQTSFPPEGRDRSARSPSMDAASVVSGSVVSGTGPPKKKRGRKAKNKDGEAGSKEATPSVAGKTPTVVSGAGGDKDGGEEDDVEEPVNIDFDREERTEEQKTEENKIRGLLVQSFDELQMDRYEHWRISKLPDAAVKRLINATVSQSVPQNVVIAVRSIAKLFAGDLIEEARRIQGKWIDATGEPQVPPGIPTPPASTSSGDAGEERDHLRGPLRPEHLREALRRYKANNQGGGVGMQELWHAQQQSGVERFSKRNGRRIFR